MEVQLWFAYHVRKEATDCGSWYADAGSDLLDKLL